MILYHFGQQHQLIIVNPNRIVIANHRLHRVEKFLIYLSIGFPVSASYFVMLVK
jgi:hypothetical protein